MSRLVIFKADWSEFDKTPNQARPTFPGGAVSDILAQHLDYSSRPTPSQGYRLLEHKHDNDAATFDHQGGVTHQRLSPWRVVRVEDYVANTGLESFDEIVITYCEYLPLPKLENPWEETAPAQVTVDSFDGDIEAFETWKQTQPTAIAQ